MNINSFFSFISNVYFIFLKRQAQMAICNSMKLELSQDFKQLSNYMQIYCKQQNKNISVIFYITGNFIKLYKTENVKNIIIIINQLEIIIPMKIFILAVLLFLFITSSADIIRKKLKYTCKGVNPTQVNDALSLISQNTKILWKSFKQTRVCTTIGPRGNTIMRIRAKDQKQKPTSKYLASVILNKEKKQNSYILYIKNNKKVVYPQRIPRKGKKLMSNKKLQQLLQKKNKIKKSPKQDQKNKKSKDKKNI